MGVADRDCGLVLLLVTLPSASSPPVCLLERLLAWRERNLPSVAFRGANHFGPRIILIMTKLERIWLERALMHDEVYLNFFPYVFKTKQ